MPGKMTVKGLAVREHLRHGQLSIKEIARRTGKSNSAVSKIKWDMKKKGQLNGEVQHEGSPQGLKTEQQEKISEGLRLAHAAKRQAYTRRKYTKRAVGGMKPACQLSVDVENGTAVQVFVRRGSVNIGSVYITSEGLSITTSKMSAKKKGNLIPFKSAEQVCLFGKMFNI